MAQTENSEIGGQTEQAMKSSSWNCLAPGDVSKLKLLSYVLLLLVLIFEGLCGQRAKFANHLIYFWVKVLPYLFIKEHYYCEKNLV